MMVEYQDSQTNHYITADHRKYDHLTEINRKRVVRLEVTYSTFTPPKSKWKFPTFCSYIELFLIYGALYKKEF